MSSSSLSPAPTAVYYFSSWNIYERKYFVNNIPIDKVPRIAYAFYDARVNPSTGHLEATSGDPWADYEKIFSGSQAVSTGNWKGTLPFHGNFGEFWKLKNIHKKKFKLLLALFGWTWSSKCSDVYRSAESRKAFVNSLITTFKKYPIFGGVSIDHEYLSSDGVNYGKEGNIARKEDGANFLLFLDLLRKSLDNNGMKHFEITMCVSAAPEKAASCPIEKIVPYLSYLEVMTYDFTDGGWGPPGSIASHHTNLKATKGHPYSVEGAVNYYLKRGVPPRKILVGVASYSRGFSGCNGLHTLSQGGSSDKDYDEGSCDIKNLPRPGAVEFWDDSAKASYSYDSKRKILNSYETSRSIKAKCKFIQQKKLGGVLVWEISGDYPIDNNNSIIKTIHENLLT